MVKKSIDFVNQEDYDLLKEHASDNYSTIGNFIILMLKNYYIPKEEKKRDESNV